MVIGPSYSAGNYDVKKPWKIAGLVVSDNWEVMMQSVMQGYKHFI